MKLYLVVREMGVTVGKVRLGKIIGYKTGIRLFGNGLFFSSLRMFIITLKVSSLFSFYL